MNTVKDDTSKQLILQAVVKYCVEHDKVFGENASAVYTLIYEEMFADGLRNNDLSLDDIEKMLWAHANHELSCI